MYVHVGLESVGHEDIEQNLNTAPAVSRNRGYRWTPSNPPSQTHCPGVRVCVCGRFCRPVFRPQSPCCSCISRVSRWLLCLSCGPIPDRSCRAWFALNACRAWVSDSRGCNYVAWQSQKRFTKSITTHPLPGTKVCGNPVESISEELVRFCSFLVTVFGTKLTFS